MSARRLKLLYLVPAHGLLGSVGPSRNVLNLARAMRPYADITVAFRYKLEEQTPAGLEVVEIDPAGRPRPGHTASGRDDSAMRGLGPIEFLAYLARLRRFTRAAVGRYDVILEKSWLLSGHLSDVARRAGGIGVPIENVVPSPRRHEAAGPLKRLRVALGRRMAGFHLRRAPLIIAETAQLQADIVRVWGVAPERVAVVGLGVDRTLFRPMDQAEARRRLGLAAEPLVLLYVGVLDETHNLEAVVTAVSRLGDPGIELHVVGDGPRRGLYEQATAGHPGRVVFHGRVPHERVPGWIAAADLCLAPYDARAFASGALGYATMKVPEYLAVGRPVASVPSGRMQELIRDGETGFLFESTAERWRRFLTSERPSRERLRAMGEAAAATPLPGWDDTARGYLRHCERLVASARAGSVPVLGPHPDSSPGRF